MGKDEKKIYHTYRKGKPWGQPTKALSVLLQAGHIASDISKLRRAGKSVERRF